MRQAFIIKSFADAYQKLLKSTLFIYLDSHWFISRDAHDIDLYVIRIKDGHEDIEYSIKNYGNNFVVVTDNEQIAKLLDFVHELFSGIDSRELDEFNGGSTSAPVYFSNWRTDKNIELDSDGTFKIQVNLQSTGY
jgi:hypothetical protein